MTETLHPTAAPLDSDGAAAPRHHLPEEVLLDYAAGGASAPMSLLVACHLAVCRRCADALDALEAVGGALLAGIEPAPLSTEAAESIARRLAEPPPAPPAPVLGGDEDLPGPLRHQLDRPVASLAWRPLVPGLREAELMAGETEALRLFSINPGRAIPRHGHLGTELTLVLRGGFSDSLGHYRPGDVAVADSDVDHQPVADRGEDCLCLAVTDAPVRLTGPFGRWLNLFVKF